MTGKSKKHMFERMAERVAWENVGQIDPKFARWMFSGPVGWLIKTLYRPAMSGWEHLPEEGPVLIVANHSGGGGMEVIALAMLWRERFGAKRPATGMAHPLAWYIPGAAQTIKGLGAVPSSYDAGLRALSSGIPVLIFPGGDYDAFRPIWQANQVDFNGRKGFLRLARDAGVPIVPLGIQGSHYTAPSLWRSQLLPWLVFPARLLGVKRAPVTLLGLLGAALIVGLVGPSFGYVWAGLLTLLWIASPVAIWAPIVPWRIRIRLGAPIAPEELFDPEPDDLDGSYTSDEELQARERAVLQRGYVRVVGEIQRLVLELRDEPG